MRSRSFQFVKCVLFSTLCVVFSVAHYMIRYSRFNTSSIDLDLNSLKHPMQKGIKEAVNSIQRINDQ